MPPTPRGRFSAQLHLARQRGEEPAFGDEAIPNYVAWDCFVARKRRSLLLMTPILSPRGASATACPENSDRKAVPIWSSGDCHREYSWRCFGPNDGPRNDRFRCHSRLSGGVCHGSTRNDRCGCHSTLSGARAMDELAMTCSNAIALADFGHRSR